MNWNLACWQWSTLWWAAAATLIAPSRYLRYLGIAAVVTAILGLLANAL